MYENYKCRIIFFLMALLFSVCSILFMELGYKPKQKWNDHSIQTFCNVTNYVIVEDSCYESCNCVHTDDGLQCQTCSYPCYDGSIELNYQDYLFQDHVKTLFMCTKNTENDVLNELQQSYPLNEELKCFYNQNDPTDLKLLLFDSKSFLFAFWFFIGFLGLLLIIWIPFEIWLLYQKCKVSV